MPAAIPVIAGGLSIAGGMAASSMVVKGLMIAGGAMSVIGGLTGNKKLAQIGGIASLAGGIGGLASGAFGGAAGAAGGQTATGLSAAANQSGNISAWLAEPAGNLAAMGGAQGLQAGAGALTGGLNTVGAAAAPAGLSSMGGGTGILASSFGNAVSTAGSGISGALGRVGGFLKDNKELVKLGGDALSGAMDRKAQMEQLKLQQQHAEALKNKDFELALKLEDEMRRRRSASITGLTPMDQTMSGNQEGGPVTRGYHNAQQPGGIIGREWRAA